MKNTLLGLLCLVSGAGATTITLTGPADFLVTDITGAPLSFRNVEVGFIDASGAFVQFAPSDASQPSIGLASGALPGRFIGNASDNSSAADLFNGETIVVNFVKGGVNVFVSSSTGVFPNNNSGVGDTFSLSAVTLDTIEDLSTPNGVFIESDVIIIVPEPSSALLAGLALVGGLIRRRR